MARIRSLKPSFFKSEDLAALSPWHRLAYQGLWCWADREGRLEDRPRRLKAEIFPYDDLDMDGLLTDLQRSGFIVRYEVDGRRYIAIPTFTDHQTPRKDEWESVLPSPDSGTVVVPSRDRDGTAAVPLRESNLKTVGSREVGSRNVGSGSGETEPEFVERRERPETRTPGHRAEDLQTLWNTVTKPPIPRCQQMTDKRRRHCRQRLAERPFEEWADVFRRVQASAFCRGESPPRNGSQPWVASFDWAVSSQDVAVKVLEGKYDDREAPISRPVSAVPDAAASASRRRELFGG